MTRFFIGPVAPSMAGLATVMAFSINRFRCTLDVSEDTVLRLSGSYVHCQ